MLCRKVNKSLFGTQKDSKITFDFSYFSVRLKLANYFISFSAIYGLKKKELTNSWSD